MKQKYLVKKTVFNQTKSTKQTLELKSILKNPKTEKEIFVKRHENELKLDKITPRKLEIVRFIDDFEENKTEKDNPKNTIKRSKAFISRLSSLGSQNY